MNVTKLMSVYVANTKFLINRNREVWNILSHQWLPTHRFDMHLKGSIVFAKYYAYTTACKSTLLYESVCCRKLVYTCIPFRVWFGNIFKVTVSLEKSNRIHIQQLNCSFWVLKYFYEGSTRKQTLVKATKKHTRFHAILSAFLQFVGIFWTLAQEDG